MPAKRGRPNREDLIQRIQEGKTCNGVHKCRECERTFPRRKSLIAHERTHTGEKPYVCTYPGCDAAFKQSGQLKTHVGRHTGILPFGCPISGCETRFLHNNRFCPIHNQKVRSDKVLSFSVISTKLTSGQIAWITEQRAKAEARRNIRSQGSSENLGRPHQTNIKLNENQSCVSFNKSMESNFESQKATAEAEMSMHSQVASASLGMPLREYDQNTKKAKTQSTISEPCEIQDYPTSKNLDASESPEWISEPQISKGSHYDSGFSSEESEEEHAAHILVTLKYRQHT